MPAIVFNIPTTRYASCDPRYCFVIFLSLSLCLMHSIDFLHRYICLQFQIIDLSNNWFVNSKLAFIYHILTTVLVESAVWNPAIIFHIIAFISKYSYWHILLISCLRYRQMATELKKVNHLSYHLICQ